MKLGKLKAAFLPALLLGAAVPASAQVPAAPTDNEEMAAMFAADQAPRGDTAAAVNWAVVAAEDDARLARTRALLDAGALRTGNDFYRAAFIFQHGSTSADYMLAHTVAVIAAARGRSDAAWIAAASMDRYLQSVGHAQIYGTQFRTPDRQNTTQEPYDRTLVPDALREALGVPTLAQQEVRRRELEARYRATPRP